LVNGSNAVNKIRFATGDGLGGTSYRWIDFDYIVDTATGQIFVDKIRK
jgi:hypothetical protein